MSLRNLTIGAGSIDGQARAWKLMLLKITWRSTRRKPRQRVLGSRHNAAMSFAPIDELLCPTKKPRFSSDWDRARGLVMVYLKW